MIIIRLTYEIITSKYAIGKQTVTVLYMGLCYLKFSSYVRKNRNNRLLKMTRHYDQTVCLTVDYVKMHKYHIATQ